MITGAIEEEDLRSQVYVVSVSGGKDSAATSLFLKEKGIPHRRVFADTGWELPETYRYIDEVLEPALGLIDRVRGPMLMEELIRHKRMFPSRRRRYCTELLKFKPIRAYLHKVMEETDAPVVNVIGVRAEESLRRRHLPEFEYDSGMGCDVWRPLISWSLEDVIEIHRRHGLTPNPLYLRGFTRVGCAPCIMANKAEVRLLSEEFPEQIDRVRTLESALEATPSKTGRPPKFFQSPLGVRVPGENELKYPCVSIDEVVDWSKTTRGGRQYDLLPSKAIRDGCMRWGLCDSGES